MEKRRILCVDDDRLVREILKEMLEELGLQVLCVKSGIECLKAFRRAPRSWSFVLVNYDMPGMDGPEVVRRLLETTTPSRIAVTSAYPEGAVFETVQREHVAGFLRKPYTLSSLRRFLRPRLRDVPVRVLLTSLDAEGVARCTEALKALLHPGTAEVQACPNAGAALTEAKRSLTAVVVIEISGASIPPELPVLHAEGVPLVVACSEEAPREELRRYAELLPALDAPAIAERVRALSTTG